MLAVIEENMKEVSKDETPMEVMASQYLGLEATEEQMIRREAITVKPEVKKDKLI